jgi:hypothetical protein
MGQRVVLCGKVKPRGVAEAKASLTRAIVVWGRPETE